MQIKLFKYFLLCILIFLGLTFIELFMLTPLIDLISFNFWPRLFIYLFLIFMINPIATKLISELFDVSKLYNQDDLK